MACFTGWPGRNWLILGEDASLLGKEGEKADRATEADTVSMGKPIQEKGQEKESSRAGVPRHPKAYQRLKVYQTAQESRSGMMS